MTSDRPAASPPSSATALDIYQRGLDQVSQAVLTRNFDGFRTAVDLPYLVRTLQANILLKTEADLAELFRSVSGSIAARGATHYERVAREARFTRPDRIEGRHFVHLLANGQHLAQPWASRQAMIRRADGWKFTEATFPFAAPGLPFGEEMLFDEAKADAALAKRLGTSDRESNDRELS